MEKSKRGGKKWLAVVAILLAVIVAAGAIWFFAAKKTGTPEKIKNEQVQIQAEDTEIPTPYGELLYLGVWKDEVEPKIYEEENSYRIVFVSTLEDAQAELFTLCYGDLPEINEMHSVFVIGQMENDDGTQTAVSMIMNLAVESEPDPAWSEETQIRLGELQMSANELMEQVRSNPAFIA